MFGEINANLRMHIGIAMELTLGLIGAGGSIITVPILVYLLGVRLEMVA